METKKCKACGKSIDIKSDYDTCDSCRNKDIENERNIVIALGGLAIVTTVIYMFFKKIINKN